MRKNKFYIFLCLCMALASCHIKPSGVLSEKKMINVLTEMHQIEGTLQVSGMDYNSPEMQKKYFDEILKKNGISRADFDSSLVWYTKHPQEFGIVYTKVLGRIDTLNAQVQKGKFHPNQINNNFQEADIWNLKRSYKITKDSAVTKVNFEIPYNNDLMVGDKYYLSFRHRIAPSDSSINPHVVMVINYLNGKKDSIYTITHKDSLLRRYTLIFAARDTLKIKSITGSLLGSTGTQGKMKASLDSIKLIRKYNAYDQIKLRQRVETKDKTPYPNLLP